VATKYLAPFSFGDVKRTTKYRSYSHAWAVFQSAESQKPLTGFSRDLRNAEIQVQRMRRCDWTGRAEIVECVEVVK
jgi:hypothetical protein